MIRRHFDEWGALYLIPIRKAAARSQPAGKVPSGAFQDIFDAWAGEFAYQPQSVRRRSRSFAVRGDAIARTPTARCCRFAEGRAEQRDIRSAAGTLMHLERMPQRALREGIAFLTG